MMNAEFNISNKKLSRRALAHVEKANTVAPDQYVYRKKTQSNQCVS